jgi:hypothetical protein
MGNEVSPIRNINTAIFMGGCRVPFRVCPPGHGGLKEEKS